MLPEKRAEHLKPFGKIVAVLIALAMAVAPMGSASASARAVALASHAAQMVETSSAEGTNHAAAGDMTDCEKMKQKPSKGDCPCCDIKGTCPPDLCPLKIFKVFGPSLGPALALLTASPLQYPDKPERPPDWIDSPQPPPPRA